MSASYVLKALKEKTSSTHFLAYFFMPSNFWFVENISSIFRAHSEGESAFNKYPVFVSTIDSVGPPELHASTIQPQYIASTGTIPKCSFSGV